MLQLFGKGAVTNPTTACAALGILAAYANATQKKKKNITELPPTAPDFRCRMAALACLRLAIKYRENQHPDPATVFARMLGPKCTAQRLMLEERAVLVALDFGPALPTAYDSFTQLARKNDIDADKASDVRANVGVAVAVALAVAPDIIKAYLPSEMAEFCIRAALRGDSAVSTESKTDATARSALRVAYNSIAFRNAMFGLMRLSGAAVRKSMWDSIRKTFKQIIEHGF